MVGMPKLDEFGELSGVSSLGLPLWDGIDLRRQLSLPRQRVRFCLESLSIALASAATWLNVGKPPALSLLYCHFRYSRASMLPLLAPLPTSGVRM